MKPKIYSKEHKEKLLEMLLIFHKFAEECNCKYFLCGGTFLGAKRHKGFIPWDYDIDIAITDNYTSKMWEVLCKLKTYGIGVDLRAYKTDAIIKIGPPNQPRDGQAIDIFIMSRDKKQKKKWVIDSELSRKRWPNYYHIHKELYPLRQYEFEGHMFPGPRTDSILKRHYGEVNGDYMIPVYHESLEDNDRNSKTWLMRKHIPVNKDGTLDVDNTIISY